VYVNDIKVHFFKGLSVPAGQCQIYIRHYVAKAETQKALPLASKNSPYAAIFSTQNFDRENVLCNISI
jgi:hypothetical protein